MEKTVLVRYGEIALKSETVRKKFEKILINNIKSSLKDIQIKVQQERGRIFLETEKPKEVAKRIAKLPGIVSTSPTWQTKANMKKIRTLANEIITDRFPRTGSFAIRARRVGEHKFTSKKLEEKIGSDTIESKPNLTVNLDSPDNELHIEVREDKAYIFEEIIPGPGGLPVGSQGKVIVPFINEVNSSIISAYLLLKRGSPTLPLFFETKAKPMKKYREINEKLKKVHPSLEFCALKIQHIVDWVSKNVSEDFRDIIQQKTLIKLGEKVAERLDAEAITINENLEDISKLSLHNLKIIQNRISIPILTPLTGIDKIRKDKIEKRIGPLTNKKNKINHGLNSFNIDKIDAEKVSRIEKSVRQKSLIERALKTLEIRKSEDYYGSSR